MKTSASALSIFFPFWACTSFMKAPNCRAAAVVWKVETEFRKSAMAASKAADSFSTAADDWESAAACEPDTDEGEKK